MAISESFPHVPNITSTMGFQFVNDGRIDLNQISFGKPNVLPQTRKSQKKRLVYQLCAQEKQKPRNNLKSLVLFILFGHIPMGNKEKC